MHINLLTAGAGGESMSGLISDLSVVVTAVLGWVGNAVETIVSTPYLLLTTGFLVIGGAVGIMGRMLSRN